MCLDLSLGFTAHSLTPLRSFLTQQGSHCPRPCLQVGPEGTSGHWPEVWSSLCPALSSTSSCWMGRRAEGV